MDELVQLLKTEEYLNRVQLKRIRNADFVIIDDLMYMAMDQREANLFFHLINHLYERSSIILTSNKSPDDWGNLIGQLFGTVCFIVWKSYMVERMRKVIG
jgi:DNA replication protein DnaC